MFVVDGDEIIGHRIRSRIQEPEVRSQEKKGGQSPAALILLASVPIVTPKK
jgi:hypothetical protein